MVWLDTLNRLGMFEGSISAVENPRVALSAPPYQPMRVELTVETGHA